MDQNFREAMTVANDGPGVTPDRLALLHRLILHPEERGQFSADNNGRSIFNISDRLRLYYGEHYAFSISSVPNERTVCSVSINRNARLNGTEETTDANRHAD